MNKKLGIQYVSYAVMAYLLLAQIWWAILLFENISNFYELKMSFPNIDSDTLADIQAEFSRKKRMVWGESTFLILATIMGFYFIQKSIRKELQLGNRQRNFLLAVTHELKSPLASIKLFLQTLGNPKIGNSDKVSLTKDALEETDRLQYLVNNLLFSAKLEKAYAYQFEATNMVQFLKDYIDKFQKKHPNTIINIDQNQNNIIAKIDLESFRIVYDNLFENALKYGQKQAEININLIEHKQGSTIHFSNLGKVIPVHEASKIFQQFYRIGNEDIRRTKGTGLGLYIVKGIIEAHKGIIKIDHDYKLGAKFVIELPKI